MSVFASSVYVCYMLESVYEVSHAAYTTDSYKNPKCQDLDEIP